MLSEFIYPGDLRTIFLQYFLGSPQLLMFMILFSISFLSAKFQLSNQNFMIILIISSLIFAGIIGQAIYVLIIMLIGFVLFKTIGKFFT